MLLDDIENSHGFFDEDEKRELLDIKKDLNCSSLEVTKQE